MWAALNRVLPPRRGKSAAEAISTRRESMCARGGSKPTNPTLIALARRLSFRVVIERTSASGLGSKTYIRLPLIPRFSHELASGSMLTRVSVNAEEQALRRLSRDSPHFADIPPSQLSNA